MFNLPDRAEIFGLKGADFAIKYPGSLEVPPFCSFETTNIRIFCSFETTNQHPVYLV